MKWTIFQAANIGPNCGNLFHFATQKKMGPEDYPIQRYGGEVQRLFNVMDKQLASNAYLAGDAYSLADVISFHWVQGFFTFLPAMLPAIGEAYDFADESKYTNLRAWVAKVAAPREWAITLVMRGDSAYIPCSGRRCSRRQRSQ